MRCPKCGDENKYFFYVAEGVVAGFYDGKYDIDVVAGHAEYLCTRCGEVLATSEEEEKNYWNPQTTLQKQGGLKGVNGE